jgi:hypothetical protein
VTIVSIKTVHGDDQRRPDVAAPADAVVTRSRSPRCPQLRLCRRVRRRHRLLRRQGRSPRRVRLRDHTRCGP